MNRTTEAPAARAAAPRRLWAELVDDATGRQVLAGSAAVAAVIVAVKLAAMVKEMVVAYLFGIAAALDAFLIALVVPSFAVTVFALSFGTALVPALVTARERDGAAAAKAMLERFLAFSLVWAALLTAALAILGPVLVRIAGPGLDGPTLALARRLFYVLLPVFFFGGLAAVLGCVLNAWHRFAFAASVPVVTALSTIALLLLRGEAWGVFALAAGVSLGFALEAALLAAFLGRMMRPLRPDWRGARAGLGPVLGEFRHLAVGAVLMGGTIVVDQAMATALSDGSVAILNYANRVTAVFLTVSGALWTVCLPYFSALVAAGDWSGLRRTLVFLCAVVVVAATPAALAVAFFSDPIVRLLFERGTFTGGDAAEVGVVQAMLVLQIPFYIVAMVGMRLIAAMERSRAMTVISLVNLVVNALANYLLMQVMGVAGIALSTTLVYALAMAMTLAFLFVEIRRRAAPAGAA